jgi:hypothetical protein
LSQRLKGTKILLIFGIFDFGIYLLDFINYFNFLNLSSKKKIALEFCFVLDFWNFLKFGIWNFDIGILFELDF